MTALEAKLAAQIMSSKLISHYIAAIAAAMLIITPLLRGVFGVPEYIYAVFGIALLILAGISERNWTINDLQLSWWVCLYVLFTYLLAASFPFTDPKAVLTAAGFLISSLSIGVLCSLYWSERFFYTIAYIIIVVGAMVSLIVVYGYFKGGGDYREGVGENAVGYLTLGSLIAVAFCMNVPFVLASIGKRKALWVLILLINGFGLIAVLSRGALVFGGFLGLVLLIYYWPQQQTIKMRLASLFSRCVAIMVALYVAFSFMPARTVGRLQRLFFGDELESGGRGKLWSDAINKVAEAPLFGHGLGEASVANIYPHNLFLQVGIDGGLLGIILLTVVIAVPLVIFYEAWSHKVFDNEALPVALLVAYLWALLEYSKSGDFYRARDLFMLASLLVGYLSFLYRKRKRLVRYSYRLENM